MTYSTRDRNYKKTFLVRPENRKLQQILWRNSKGEIDTYQLNTVTFGLSAAPYLAIRCLTQLAEDEGHQYPRAATVLRRDFYVDDVLTGVDTRIEALSLSRELTELLNIAGLNIRKWASNDRKLLKGLPEQDINDKLLLGESQIFKTLGVVWNSSDDSILYSVKTNPFSDGCRPKHLLVSLLKCHLGGRQVRVTPLLRESFISPRATSIRM
jgi:hypothetical protein